jgi:hypothetical protein
MKNLFMRIAKFFNRATFAYLLMVSFILFTTVGAALVYAPAGFITAGVACGLFGYLLGRE